MSKDKVDERFSRQYFKILNNTWFVEVHSIPLGAKKVTRKNLLTGQIPYVRCHIIATMIDRCQVGFRIARIQDLYILLDTEEREVEVIGIPSGTLSFFYTKITPSSRTLTK